MGSIINRGVCCPALPGANSPLSGMTGVEDASLSSSADGGSLRNSHATHPPHGGAAHLSSPRS